MISQDSEDNLPEERRREIFLALVDAQDHEMTVSQSRQAVASHRPRAGPGGTRTDRAPETADRSGA